LGAGIHQDDGVIAYWRDALYPLLFVACALTDSKRQHGQPFDEPGALPSGFSMVDDQ
jgi:hypothetical protein